MTNQVILNKDQSTWPRIKKYWEAKGVDMSNWTGDCTNDKTDWCYYGFIDGSFGNYRLSQVENANAEIIELPEENVEWKFTALEFLADEASSKNEKSFDPHTYKQGFIDGFKANPKEEKKYPRVMWVWENGKEDEKVKRVVFMEKMGGFMAWNAETIEGSEKTYLGGHWDNASDIEGIEPEATPKKKYPVYPKSILRLAYEIIGRLKAENLRRAGFNDIEITTYLQADKELKEIEIELQKCEQ